jgi:hypothetical protein
MGKSLGYERMFWKMPKSWSFMCPDCGREFELYSLLYSHKELWHVKPLLKLSGITTLDTSGEPPTKAQASQVKEELDK